MSSVITIYYLQKLQKSRTNSDMMGESNKFNFVEKCQIDPLVYVWKSIHEYTGLLFQVSIGFCYSDSPNNSYCMKIAHSNKGVTHEIYQIQSYTKTTYYQPKKILISSSHIKSTSIKIFFPSLKQERRGSLDTK